MLIFDLYRLSTRTFRRLLGGRAAARQDAEPIYYARSGLFASPAAVGLLTGALAAAVNLLPTALLGWTYFNRPVLFTIIIFVTVNILCSGPFLLTLSARCLVSTLRFSFLFSLAAVLPAFLIFQMRVYSLYRFYYTLSVVFRIAGSYLLGRHLGRNYGALASLNRCGLLCIAGNLPMILFECYLAWMWDYLGKRGEMSREQLAFFVMAFLISQIGVTTLPALAAEPEFRQRVRVSLETLALVQPKTGPAAERVFDS